MIMDIKEAIKELDQNFGKDFSKNHPELVIKLVHAKSMENAGEKIAESIEALATKMELSAIRGGGSTGMGAMDSMGMGAFGSMSSGMMGKLGDMPDMSDFDLDDMEEVDDDDNEEK